MKKQRLQSMPFDKVFITESGNEELCHATGYEVQFPGSDDWWNEYIDSAGELHYGR